MTDEMTVKAQRPSALPYVAGGALAGAAIGGASAKYGNFGITSPRYSSWEDAIKDSNDEFVKKQVEKGGDKKADWEKVQTAQKEVNEAKKKVTEAIPEKIRDNADVKDYLAKLEAQEKAEAKALKDLEAKITKGEMKEKVTKEVEEVVDKSLKDAALEDKAKELLEKTNKAVFDKGAEDAEYKKALSEIKDKITKGEMKEKVTKEVEEVVDKNLKGDDLTKKAKELLGKNKPEEVTKAEKATTEALEKAKKVEGFIEDIVTKVESAREGVKAAKDKAKTTLTDDLLKGLKSASTWKTAGIGAIILGLGALLLRPKAE